MEARYLRVKNWREHQHYRDRRPPWIKLLRELIDGDNGREFREQLSEPEQWQLVRLWLYASGSERVMHDAVGRELPLVAFDEKTLRIGIRSMKKIPLEKFIRLGFLELVSAEEADASVVASATASAAASKEVSKTDVVTPPPSRAGSSRRGLEVSERALPRAVIALRPAALGESGNGPGEISIDHVLKDIA
jgi:hypothetical protein